MIKQLRLRFVALSVGAFSLVLLLVLVVINGLNYRQIYQYADRSLDLIWSNEGAFPVFKEPRSDLPPRFNSPEAPYEVRFFSVLFRDDGEDPIVNVDQIAAIDRDTALTYAREAADTGRERGNMGEYRYISKPLRGDDRLLVFLDFGQGLNNAKDFLLISGALYVCALVVVCILLILFSGRAIRPIAESYEKQKQFITDAGHELKTPITIINADSEVLAMEIGENEWLRDIQAQCKNMGNLTRDLIGLSRMEEDHGEMEMIDLPFSDLISEIAQSFRAPAAVRGITISVNASSVIGVYGNEKSLRRLVTILLDNAVKYADENSVITVDLTCVHRQILLTVSNPCPPISKEEIRHLFDRFYRVDRARSNGSGGYGIGLSVAKAIVGAHKGKIRAGSKDGASLSVTASLPRSGESRKE